MKKQNLVEEIYRMRKLMNFDSKEFNENVTSEDRLFEEKLRIKNLLSEQEGEPNWEWIKKELEKGQVIITNEPECFNVGTNDDRITGTFKEKVTEGSTAVENFVKTLLNNIENNENAKKYIGKGGKFSIEEMDIIAGASNYINGSITPTMDNNYKPLNITKGSSEDLKYKHGIGSDNYNYNMNTYAKGRGEGVRDGLIKAFDSIDGFEMKPENIKITNHIIDTGGVIDGDPKALKNPGQVVLVWMKICWINTEELQIPPVIEEFNRCMTGLSVVVGFDKNKQGRVTHKCNHAKFKIYVNDVPLTRTGYNTGKKPSSFDPKTGNYADLNNKSDGGSRWNEFDLSTDEVAQLVTLDSLKKYTGEIQVQGKCIPNKEEVGWTDKRVIVYVPNEGIELPKTGMVLYKTPNGPKRQYLDSGKDGNYKPVKDWIAIAIKYANPQSGILPTTPEGYIPEDIIKELKIEGINTTWDDVMKNSNAKKILYDFYKNSGKVQKNKKKGQKGCHEGVAEVILKLQGKELETSTVTTPRFESGGIINLGPPMEGCKKQWVKLVDASKDQPFE